MIYNMAGQILDLGKTRTKKTRHKTLTGLSMWTDSGIQLARGPQCKNSFPSILAVDPRDLVLVPALTE